jgi:hypothetical protein
LGPPRRRSETQDQEPQRPQAERALQDVLRVGAELVGHAEVEVRHCRHEAADVDGAAHRIEAQNEAPQ